MKHYDSRPQQLHVASRDFMSLPLLISALFSIITKLSKAGGGVLGYRTEDYQRNILLSESWMKFPFKIAYHYFFPLLVSNLQIRYHRCTPNT